MKFFVYYNGEESVRKKTAEKLKIQYDFLHNVSLDNHLREIKAAFNNLGVSFANEAADVYCIQVANSRTIFNKKDPLATQLSEIPENAQLIFQINPKLRSIRTIEKLKSSSNVKEIVFDLKMQLSDPAFTEEFIEQGGMPLIMDIIHNSSGNTQSYSLAALRVTLSYVSGMRVMLNTPGLLQKLFSFIESPVVSVCRQALELLFVTCTFDERGGQIIHAAKQGLPYTSLSKLLRSGDLDTQINCLTLINSLLQTAPNENERKELQTHFEEKLRIRDILKSLTKIEHQAFRHQLQFYENITGNSILEHTSEDIRRQLREYQLQQPLIAILRSELQRAQHAILEAQRHSSLPVSAKVPLQRYSERAGLEEKEYTGPIKLEVGRTISGGQSDSSDPTDQKDLEKENIKLKTQIAGLIDSLARLEKEKDNLTLQIRSYSTKQQTSDPKVIVKKLKAATLRGGNLVKASEVEENGEYRPKNLTVHPTSHSPVILSSPSNSNNSNNNNSNDNNNNSNCNDDKNDKENERMKRIEELEKALEERTSELENERKQRMIEVENTQKLTESIHLLKSKYEALKNENDENNAINNLSRRVEYYENDFHYNYLPITITVSEEIIQNITNNNNNNNNNINNNNNNINNNNAQNLSTNSERINKRYQKDNTEMTPSKPLLQPSKSMKPFFWKKFIQSPSSPHSVWSSLPEFEFDSLEIENAFSIYQKERRVKSKYSYEILSLSIFNEERREQIAELIRILPPENVVKLAIETIDDAILPPKQLSLLLQNLLAESEIIEIEEAIEAEIPVRPQECYLYNLHRNIPKLCERISCWVFANKFKEISFNLIGKFQSSLSAISEIRNSKSLRCFLAAILTIGNYVNGGTKRGQADGYDIETLDLVRKYRDNSNMFNLSQYAVRLIKEKAPAALNIVNEFQHLRAEAINLPVYAEQFRNLSNEYDVFCENSLLFEDDNFEEWALKFHDYAGDTLAKLEQIQFELSSQTSALISYFNPLDPSLDPTIFFSALRTFVESICNEIIEDAKKEADRGKLIYGNFGTADPMSGLIDAIRTGKIDRPKMI